MLQAFVPGICELSLMLGWPSVVQLPESSPILQVTTAFREGLLCPQLPISQAALLSLPLCTYSGQATVSIAQLSNPSRPASRTCKGVHMSTETPGQVESGVLVLLEQSGPTLSPSSLFCVLYAQLSD